MATTLEESHRDRKDHVKQLVEYMRDTTNIVEKHLEYAINDYYNRVVWQEVALLIMMELGLDTFEINSETVDKVNDAYVGKLVHVTNEVNEDGSRTIKLSVSEIKTDES